METDTGSVPRKRRSARRGSVSTKIILVQVAVVLVIMAANGAVSALLETQRLRTVLRQREEQLLARLPSTLSAPLWNIDNVVMDSILATEMVDTDVLAIVVKSTSGTMGKRRDSGGTVVAWTKPDEMAFPASRSRRLSSNIIYQGKAIGTVDIYLSNSSITDALRATLLQTAFAVGVVIMLLSLSTLIIIRLLVARPLKLVDHALGRFAGGDLSSTVTFRSQSEIGVLAQTFNVMAERLKGTMEDLRRSEEKYRGIFENSMEGFFQSTLEGRFLTANPSMAVLLGYDSPADLTSHVTDIGRQLFVRPEDREETVATLLSEGKVSGREIQLRRKDGEVVWVSVHERLLRGPDGVPLHVDGFIHDVTERRKLEAQLLQSRKMESVGLLAGGVAHDFNNLLTPILGYAEIMASSFTEGDPLFGLLEEIRSAAERARDLTQQLLAFSRKQVMVLKTVDLGEIIRRFKDILRRTIRENIHIEIAISPSLSAVRADAGQIEQVLLNLSINAQDAMPSEGGALVIEAADVDFGESYSAHHPETPPGQYVMLAVSDTGAGMDEQTLEHIFDPFFTTKEPGKGTGLGLSTVYGIVKQHGGSINVYSEKSHGSTFKILLPRAAEERVAMDQAPPSAAPVQGTETILVAEDEETVRRLACTMLGSLGYRVLAADTVESCIALAGAHRGRIDLLLTDVIMPKMNGRELYNVLQRGQRDLKVLFMSGYSGSVITHHGVLDEGMQFIQKPFTLRALSAKVRLVLDSAS
jgi:two-component system, cell cycle sensor histidine kinase and response regulator CckA